MADEPKSKCPHCGRQNLRVTEAGWVWPHSDKAGNPCLQMAKVLSESPIKVAANTKLSPAREAKLAKKAKRKRLREVDEED